MEKLNWIFELKEKVPQFLERLKGEKIKGFFHYSLSGDLYDENIKWGLGNAVFAAKILYMLNALTDEDCDSISAFITSFQDSEGYIHDPMVQKKSRLRRFLSSIKHYDFNNLWNEQTKRAETRQSFAALRCMGRRPNIPYLHIPYTKDGITKYINQLDWTKPWGAGSHVSHLLFFLNNNNKIFYVYKNETEELINHAIVVVNRYQQRDGSWYAHGIDMPIYQKINGAMKIMTAYETAEKDDFANPEGLIDLCLSTINDGHACNNFNIVCILYHCSKKTKYKRTEIESYFLERLKLYKEHYWLEHGGFSFFKRRANDIYYGAKVSKGLAEPDIHGTVLFLWGIVLISKILNLNNDLNFKVPIT